MLGNFTNFNVSPNFLSEAFLPLLYVCHFSVVFAVSLSWTL